MHLTMHEYCCIVINLSLQAKIIESSSIPEINAIKTPKTIRCANYLCFKYSTFEDAETLL